jgi:hypothetical protein
MLQGGILHNPDMDIRTPIFKCFSFWQAVLPENEDKMAQTPLEDRINTSIREIIICKNLLRIPTILPLNNIEVVISYKICVKKATFFPHAVIVKKFL